MSIRVALRHRTRYDYDRPVSLGPHVVRLRPAAHSRTPIHAYSLNISPKDHFINWQQDPFGNYLARLVFPEKTTHFEIDVEVIADMTVINPFDFFVEEYAEEYPFKYDEALKEELKPYLKKATVGPLLKDWLGARIPKRKMRTLDFLVEINQYLEQDIDYTTRMEPGVQSCEVTLEKALGSCRDSAWLLVEILRQQGLAARFVSGYLVQLTADEKSLDGPSGPEQDFTDLHAWVEVYLPGAGWVGLDPTSGLFAAEGHIPLACTPDTGSAAPVTGAMDECEVEFDHENSVTRVVETPRVTKPYSADQWEYIVGLGEKIDADLNANDVRLTMGGEPTFVSLDDRDGAEWDFAALSDNKWRLARSLLTRMQAEFSPGSLLHFGQGKWYPGEPLPRWQMGSYWRTDGVPLWNKPELFAEPEDPNQRLDDDEVAAFARAVTECLGVAAENLIPAYEDRLYYLWKESELPTNVPYDPEDEAIKSDKERLRLIQLLQRGLDSVTGYVLPLAWDWTQSTWQSQRWEFHKGRLTLSPGDSPMGLRLPLESLPVASKEEKRREPMVETDPFAALPDLPPQSVLLSEASKKALEPEPEPEELAADDQQLRYQQTIRTALCFEQRDGMVHIFMPPILVLEHYLSVIAAIESVADEFQMPIRLEGYEPPQDFRLKNFKVTPDPGVIEVNIHPSASWEQLVKRTTTLYELARLTRLSTEKFMLDGRHTGTGGGNHVTMGAAVPQDSPFLRRPDLLRSLITFWQHHPGLSYLFAGMFIGPTSQAPRVDEGRDEALYELEIAFNEMPEGEVMQPWLVDRMLRNLLIDVTGNTHRAEFCIDKLFSPDSASGRLGLVEFRAFEMPPHAQMSLVQMLLLRALVAMFWQQPYKKSLVRWGTTLHDRFMLPHNVRADMKDIAQTLQDAGYPFQLEWLDPFMEFRFPHYGEVRIEDIHIELRAAIEPWHVLGEEVTRQGTARFVDSSVERLQVKVTGLTDSRYVLACNGRRVPLHNTGTHGEYIAGVKYRAWAPPSALHPTIGVHSPLVFDLIDTWNGRAVGGCTYFVSHPGGRSYDDYPVNANAAETRRVSRFWDMGHTPGVIHPPPEQQAMGQFLTEGSGLGPMAPPPEERNPDYPYTLDLRRKPQ